MSHELGIVWPKEKVVSRLRLNNRSRKHFRHTLEILVLEVLGFRARSCNQLFIPRA